jgi:hypothetical protein
MIRSDRRMAENKEPAFSHQACSILLAKSIAAQAGVQVSFFPRQPPVFVLRCWIVYGTELALAGQRL